MAKSYNQKLKILYVLEALKKTNEDNILTVRQIIDYLNSCGIKAERKSIYSDLEALESFGYDIIRTKGKNCGVFLGQREFEVPELKLLADAVLASKFITEKKSENLIKKIAALGSGDQASLQRRQIVGQSSVKTQNERIYNNIDRLHTAISEDKTVSFAYYTYVVKDGVINKDFRHEGERYVVSPLSLIWDDENYYLISYEEKTDMIKHFRVDKMEEIKLTKKPRLGLELFDPEDISGYTNLTFSMFGGEDKIVRISCHNSIISPVIDRYGEDITILKESPDRFVFSTKVKISPIFFSWVFSFGNNMKILSPQSVVEQMQSLIADQQRIYNIDTTE